MGAKGKKRWGENYECLVDEWKGNRKRGCMEGATSRLCRPLRIFQFFTILVLFAMIVYMTAMSLQHLTHLASILLIILTAAYLFFMGIDMISQFDGSELPESPMFFFSFLGMLFFAVAGALLIYYPALDNNFWALILSKILCFVVSVLFLIEVTMLLASWRQRCLSWARCCPYTPGVDYCQKETKMLFSGDDAQDIDAEFGRLDAATSVSNYAVPLEDIDTAVQYHGRRRITVGHRRQYVDSQSSAPALSVTQPAEIQTERECTVITECQTQRIETKEIIVQTNSRCELCNRQIEEQPSPRVAATPYPNQTVLPEPQRSLGGNCAVCPAFLRMMQEGMGSPCCKSCNCGATEPQRTKYPPDRTSQPRNPEGHSPPRWSPKGGQRSPRLSNVVKPSGSESPSTTNGKSDGERSDLLNEEGNRYRPIKKISRVYETRPCPTHGSGLAARMAGLPESVTKVTLSSICVKRNKRTQTPTKDSPVARDGENKATEETVKENIEERRGTCVTESKERESIERNLNRAKIGERKEKLSEDRLKLINEVEPKRGSNESRKSGSATPRKLYRNSEPILPPNEPILPASDDFSLHGVCRVRTTKEETGQMMWKSERTEIREVGQAGRLETRLGDELPILEETNEETYSEKSRTYPKYRPALQQDEPVDSVTEAGEKITHNVVVTDLKDSEPVSGPVLRLRLETDEKKAASETSESVISGAVTTESEISSKNRQAPITRPIHETKKVYRSREAKDDGGSHDKSAKSQRDSHEHFPAEGQKPADRRAEMKSKGKREHPSDEEEIIEESQAALSVRGDYSATSRIKRTRSVTRKDEDS